MTGAGARLASLFAVASAALSACAPAKPTGAVEPAPLAPACVQILGWNDLHGHLGPTRRELDSGRVPLGGATALADEVSELRARGLPTIVLDAGDLFTGPLESTMAEGRPVIEAYRLIGVDAAALGNHEFDFGPVGDPVFARAGLTDAAGPDGPRGALLARMQEASFPFLAANVTKSDGSPTGWPNHRASVVIERGGFRVGVVGYTTQETPTTTLPPNVVGLSFSSDAAGRVAGEIRRLRAAGVAPIVLVAHASLEGELPQDLDDPKDPSGKGRVGELAKLFDGMAGALPDLVIAGHRHAWLLGRVRGVPIASSSQHGVGLHVARFCASAAGGAPKLVSLERRVAVGQTPPRTELGRKVAAAMQPYRERVAAIEGEAVTKIPAPCIHRSKDPTALQEQVALATLEAAKAAFGAEPGGGKGSWLGLVNAGGLRAGLRAGDVTYGDVFGVFPFENTVAYCATTRAGLTRALENLGHASSAAERFPFGLAGGGVVMRRRADGLLDVGALDLTQAPGAAKPSPDDRVLLALSDFLLWGGDDLLKGVTCSAQALSSARMRDAWRKVLERDRRCDGPSKSVRVE